MNKEDLALYTTIVGYLRLFVDNTPLGYPKESNPTQNIQ